jgi:secreted trypsin-like serine protease
MRKIIGISIVFSLALATVPSDASFAVTTADATTTEPSSAPASLGSNTPEPTATATPAPEQAKIVSPTEKIVSGYSIGISSAPWQVALLRYPGSTDYLSQFCGGSIISASWIVTAAHCVAGKTVSDIRVLAGAGSLSSSSYNGVSIKQIVSRSDYNASSHDNDIALIQLTTPLQLNGSKAAIDLATAKPSGGSSAVITGWGNTFYSSPYGGSSTSFPYALQQASIIVRSDYTCSGSSDKYNATTMLCAGGIWTADTCQGDSGGPLAVNVGGVWTLAGVTSWGIGCASSYPGMYANVANYTSWIRTTANITLGTTTPTITGANQAHVGVTLEAVPGTWTPAGVSFSYQWRAGDTPVGTDSAFYTPTDSDIGKQITVSVTGSLVGYPSSTVTSAATSVVTGNGLSLTPTPTMSIGGGVRTVGRTLEAFPGRWDDGVSFSYQWYRGGNAVSGATNKTYALTPVDLGQSISVAVTGSKPTFIPVTMFGAGTAGIGLGTINLSPFVTGLPVVGKTLSATPGITMDGMSLSYEWLRNGRTIPGANTSTYLVSGADLSSAISVKVTASASAYNTNTVTSAATPAISAGALDQTSVPVVNGTPAVGQVLSVDTGTWDAGVTFAYQWKRNNVAIPGATSATYALVADDLGKYMSVVIRGFKTGYVSQVASSPQTDAVSAGTLSSTPTPLVSGTRGIGKLLTATAGTWDAGVSLRYQWLRNGAPIVGATGSSYQLTAADYGTWTTVTVTGSKPGYTSVTQSSDATEPVLRSLATTPIPTMSIGGGVRSVGRTLEAFPGTWDTGVTFSYQWFRGTSAIDGAVAKTYTLTPSDLGAAISVRVTGSKNDYATITVASAPTAGINPGTLAATGNPSISGTAEVGQTLNVDTGYWAPDVSFRYEWLRNGQTIPGATGSTYLLVANDLGAQVSARVTGSSRGYNVVIKASSVTPLIARGKLAQWSNPSLVGTQAVGRVLSVDTGTWDQGVSFTYQWLRNGVAIGGATQSTYLLGVADLGQRMSVSVVGSRTGFLPKSATSGAGDPVVTGTLTSSPSPTVSGLFRVGEQLSASTGVWDQGATFSFQWFRNDIAIPGATGPTYRLVIADLGAQLKVRVVGSKTAFNSETRFSQSTPAIKLALTNTPAPTISPIRKVGLTIEAYPGTWDAGVTFAYQWFRGTTAIPGATNKTYTLVVADLGANISVKVTGSKADCDSVTTSSIPSAPIPVGDLTLRPTPTVSGTTTVNETLSADPGVWDDGVTLSYQWLRNGQTISGATASTYVLVAADVNTQLSVRVTGSKFGYSSTAKESSLTSSISRASLLSTPIPSVSGSYVVGGVLVASPGQWDVGVTFTYQWLRNGAPISGSTAASYTLVAADFGQTVMVRVTGNKPGYTSVSQTSPDSGTVNPGTLTQTPTPTVSGTFRVTQLLTSNVGNWGTGVTLSYQWYRNGQPISGAILNIYRIRAEDYGQTLSLGVTGSKPGFTSQVRFSASTPPVDLGLFADSPNPWINGSLRVGNVLTASNGTWFPQPTGFNYQWQRNGGPIPGANGSSYQLTSDDAGAEISVEVEAVGNNMLSTKRWSSRLSNWTRTTKTATYNAWDLVRGCVNYGDSYAPCSSNSSIAGVGGARLYSSGYGDTMLVGITVPTEGALQRYRITFRNATSYSYSSNAFVYASLGGPPYPTSNWHDSMAFPTWFSNQDVTTPWTSYKKDGTATFVIGCLGWQSLYVQYITIEYETIL